MNAVEIVATKLATLTKGECILDNVVRVTPSVQIAIHSGEITLRTEYGQVFETFRAGLTYRQIADHVMNVVRGTATRPLEGSVVTGPWCGQKAHV